MTINAGCAPIGVMAAPKQPTEAELRTIRAITDQEGGATRIEKICGISKQTIGQAAGNQWLYPTTIAEIVRAAEQLLREDIQNSRGTGETK